MGLLLQINSFPEQVDNCSKIKFYDLNPNVQLKNSKADTAKIDFNGDFIDDIIFFLIMTSSGNYAYIKPLNSEWKVTTLNYNNIDTLNSNQIKWANQDMNFLGMDNTEKLAVKLTVNNLNYYGWIYVFFTVENLTRILHVDKYAFCTIPDYPLIWGQTELTGTKDFKIQDKIKVTVDNQSQSINIQSKEVVKEISLINSAGRIIRKWRNIKSSKVDISSEGIRGGVYILRIKTENDEVVTEKIVL